MLSNNEEFWTFCTFLRCSITWFEPRCVTIHRCLWFDTGCPFLCVHNCYNGVAILLFFCVWFLAILFLAYLNLFLWDFDQAFCRFGLLSSPFVLISLPSCFSTFIQLQRFLIVPNFSTQPLSSSACNHFFILGFCSFFIFLTTKR